MFTSFLHALSTLTAVMAVLDPLPDFWQIYKTRSTGSVSVLPVILIFCNCYAWVMYARLVNSKPPLFVTYAVGMLASIAFGGIYYHWTHDHARIHKLYGNAFYVLAGYTLYYIQPWNKWATKQSGDSVENTLGTLSGLINVALYASPLETVTKVIETKDASMIPITISVLLLVNGVIWVLHSIAEDDMLVLVPNAIGLALCIVQVVLYAMYYPHNSKEVGRDSTSSTTCETTTDLQTMEYLRLKDGDSVACVQC